MKIIRKEVDKNDEQMEDDRDVSENNLATFTKVIMFLHQ